MKKRYFYNRTRLIWAWIFVLSILIIGCLKMEVKVNAAETTGTLGDNNGFTWTYEDTTKTLTVTGSDTGLYGTEMNGSLFASLDLKSKKSYSRTVHSAEAWHICVLSSVR